MISQKRIFFLSLFSFTALFSEQKKSFIVPAAPIKESINTLKEQVATEVQHALKELTKLQKKTSALLDTLAETQQQLLKAGSSIIKEKEGFKKASKESLVEAKKKMSTLQLRCNEGERMLSVLIDDAKKVSPFSTRCFGKSEKESEVKKA
jgi:septal ring factor EnvC (AmiA/AmiB activator)